MNRWYKKGPELAEEIKGLNVSKDAVAFWNIGQCGYIYKYDGKVILIDPVLNDFTNAAGESMRYYEIPFAPENLQADYVFCTHGHIDHMAGETLQGLAKANEKLIIVIPEGCKKLATGYGLKTENIRTLSDGENLELPGLSVTAFSTAHPTHVYDKEDEKMSLGYHIHLGETTVTHLGDTYLTQKLLEGLKTEKKINLFFPPINGDDYFRMMDNCIGNMEAEEAAKLAVELGVELTVPTHYDMVKGNTVDPLRFVITLKELAPNAKWALPTLGECYWYQNTNK